MVVRSGHSVLGNAPCIEVVGGGQASNDRNWAEHW